MVGWPGRRGNMAKKKVRKVGLNQLVVLSCLAYIKKKKNFSLCLTHKTQTYPGRGAQNSGERITLHQLTQSGRRV